MNNSKEYIPVCLASDNNFAQHCRVVITSLLHNSNRDDKLRIYILDGGISAENKSLILKLKKKRDFELIFIDIDNEDYGDFYISNSRYTVASYYRINIPLLIPNEKKIIYVDCDVIVKRSLSELYSVDITDFHLAATETQTSEKNKKRLQMPENSTYYCAGVMLMNLEKWRTDNISHKLSEFIHNVPPEKLKNIDQDAINAVLFESIKSIPQNWNTEERTDLEPTDEYKKILSDPYIIHYISNDKPWYKNTKQNTHEYNKYLKLSLE